MPIFERKKLVVILKFEHLHVGGGVPLSFAVLARCLSFLGTGSVVSVFRHLSPSCEGIPAGQPTCMSPGIKNSDEEVPAGGPMSPGV